MSEPDLETRISTAIAARYLGVTRRHVEKLIHAGALKAWNVKLPNAKHARWSVTVSSVRLLLEQRARKTRTEDTSSAFSVAKPPRAARSS